MHDVAWCVPWPWSSSWTKISGFAEGGARRNGRCPQCLGCHESCGKERDRQSSHGRSCKEHVGQMQVTVSKSQRWHADMARAMLFCHGPTRWTKKDAEYAWVSFKESCCCVLFFQNVRGCLQTPGTGIASRQRRQRGGVQSDVPGLHLKSICSEGRFGRRFVQTIKCNFRFHHIP